LCGDAVCRPVFMQTNEDMMINITVGRVASDYLALKLLVNIE